MFGADTPLVMDALQIAALALLAGGGVMFWVMRRRDLSDVNASQQASNPADLESRVQVLERIATDRTADLAYEIESLREHPLAETRTLEGETR